MFEAVITGMGVQNAIGAGVPNFELSLRQGTCGIRHHQIGPNATPTIMAALTDYDFATALTTITDLPELTRRLARRVALRLPLSTRLSVSTALEAFCHARLQDRGIARERLGLVIAGQNLSQNYSYGLRKRFDENPDYLLPSYALQFLDTNQVGAISEVLGIGGEGFTVGGASAGGNVALLHARRMLACGEADACVVVGAMADLSPLEMQAFFSVGAMAGKKFKDHPQAACRPFDRDREGFVYGEGTACVILETQASAQRRQVPVLGTLIGASLKLDGNSLTNPNKDGEIAVMQACLAQAGISPSQVDYVNSHGTASVLGDETEAAALCAVFGAHQPMVNSTKSLTGHCLYAAGLVEAVACLIQMNGGFVHANLNLEHPMDTSLNLAPAQAQDMVITHALSNSFGFGGINTSILLRSP